MPQGPSDPDQFLATRRHLIFAPPHLTFSQQPLQERTPHTAQFQRQLGGRKTPRHERERREMPARGPLRDGRGGAEPGDEKRPERAARRPRGAPRAAAGPRPTCAGGGARGRPRGRSRQAAHPERHHRPPRSPRMTSLLLGRSRRSHLRAGSARAALPPRASRRIYPSPRRVAGTQHHPGSAACPALTRRRAGSRGWHPAAGWVSPRGVPLPYRPPLCAASRRSSPPAAAHDSRRLPTAAAAAAVPPVGAVSGTAGAPAPALLQPAPQDASCRPGSPRAGRGRELPAAARGGSGLRGTAVPCQAALAPVAWARLCSLLPALGDPCMPHKARRKA